jgi:hypothetical protein
MRDKIIHYAMLVVPGLLAFCLVMWPKESTQAIAVTLGVIAIANKFVQTPAQKAYVNELQKDLVNATQDPNAPAIAKADSKRPEAL